MRYTSIRKRTRSRGACQHQIWSCAFERASKAVPATTGAASLEILGDSTDDLMYNMPNSATEKEKKWGKTANAIGRTVSM